MASEAALRALLAIPEGGRLTGTQLEDRAAVLARRLNAIGITADPGQFGGVVAYLTPRQASVVLVALEILPEGE